MNSSSDEITIHTNKLRSYGSKLVGKMSPECPEHSPKLGAQLRRINFCRPGECAWESERVQILMFGVLSLVSVHNRK